MKYVEAHKLPMDLQHEYFVITPPGVESCFEANGHNCSDGLANTRLLRVPQLHRSGRKR